jgi:hypothetical protein
MKKILIGMSFMLLISPFVRAERPYAGEIARGTFTYTTNASIDLNNIMVNGVSVEVIYSSYVASAVTVNQNSVNSGTDRIYSSNTYPIGLPVLLTLNSGTIPTGLTANATYYATADNASIGLSSSSALAVAETLVGISTAPTCSITLTPIVLTGTPTIKLKASNDGVNFSDLYIGTDQCIVSFVSPYTSGSGMWDIGDTYFKYLRITYTTGTWGGVNLIAILNGIRK